MMGHAIGILQHVCNINHYKGDLGCFYWEYIVNWLQAMCILKLNSVKGNDLPFIRGFPFNGRVNFLFCIGINTKITELINNIIALWPSYRCLIIPPFYFSNSYHPSFILPCFPDIKTGINLGPKFPPGLTFMVGLRFIHTTIYIYI